MKPIDQWNDQDIVDATLGVRRIFEALDGVYLCVEELPDELWGEASDRWYELAQALTDVFGENWYDWLDVDVTPAEMGQHDTV